MKADERAHQIVTWFQQEGHPYYDELLEIIQMSIEAAEADAVAAERRRIRGNEVLPLIRTIREVGDLAEQSLSERRWVARMSRILLTVRGCEIVWPDLFDEARPRGVS